MSKTVSLMAVLCFMRHVALLCLAIQSAAALAQVTTRDAAPGLDQGVIAAWKDGARISLDNATSALGDFSITSIPESHLRFEIRTADWALTREGDTIVFKMTTTGGKQVVMETPPLAISPHSIVVSIKRDARQALSGLWIDGVEMASVAVAPGSLKWDATNMKPNARMVRIYDRALTRPEILEFSRSQSSSSLPPFPGEFTVKDGDVIAVLGGTEAVGLVESAWFESALMIFAAGKKVAVRDLSWEADTTLRQDRPMNFGSLAQQLQRTGTTTVMLMFGRQDCIEMGAGGAQAFYDALEKIVKTCAAQTRRIVIIGPVPFEKKELPLPDLSTRNTALSAYSDAAYAMAENEHCLFVDVLREWPKDAKNWTSDGLTLTDTGQRILARLIATHLWNDQALDANSGPLRKLIIEKNKLWHDYWRPSNWAFLHGDRTAQPSSRDHLNPSARWFPAELERYLELIELKERDIRRQAAARGGKLP